MVAMEKNVHLHIVWCVGRERAWIHVQGFRLSSSIRLTGFNITPLAKLHATANFCSMKKKSYSRIFEGKKQHDLYPSTKKTWGLLLSFVPFCLEPDWRCIAFPNSKCTRTLLNLQLVGKKKKKFVWLLLLGKKSNECVIAFNLIFWCYVLTLYLNYALLYWRQESWPENKANRSGMIEFVLVISRFKLSLMLLGKKEFRDRCTSILGMQMLFILAKHISERLSHSFLLWLSVTRIELASSKPSSVRRSSCQIWEKCSALQATLALTLILWVLQNKTGWPFFALDHPIGIF